METIAVVLTQPEQVELSRLALTAPTADDVVVDGRIITGESFDSARAFGVVLDEVPHVVEIGGDEPACGGRDGLTLVPKSPGELVGSGDALGPPGSQFVIFEECGERVGD